MLRGMSQFHIVELRSEKTEGAEERQGKRYVAWMHCMHVYMCMRRKERKARERERQR